MANDPLYDTLTQIRDAVQRTGKLDPSNVDFVKRMAKDPDPQKAAIAYGILVTSGNAEGVTPQFSTGSAIPAEQPIDNPMPMPMPLEGAKPLPFNVTPASAQTGMGMPFNTPSTGEFNYPSQGQYQHDIQTGQGVADLTAPSMFTNVPGADWLANTGLASLDPNFDPTKDPGLVLGEYLDATGQSPELTQLYAPYVTGMGDLYAAMHGGQAANRESLLGGLQGFTQGLSTPGQVLDIGNAWGQMIDPSQYAGNPLAGGAAASSPDFEYNVISQGVQSLAPYLGETAYKYLKSRVDAAYLEWRKSYAENPGGVPDFATYLQGQQASGWTG